MTKLLELNLGFNNLEHFNEALHLEIRSEKLKKRILEGKNPEKKVVKEAMLLKVRDEEYKNNELDKEMRNERRKIKDEQVDRESVKHIVLDCPDFMAKEIIVRRMRRKS